MVRLLGILHEQDHQYSPPGLFDNLPLDIVRTLYSKTRFLTPREEILIVVLLGILASLARQIPECRKLLLRSTSWLRGPRCRSGGSSERARCAGWLRRLTCSQSPTTSKVTTTSTSTGAWGIQHLLILVRVVLCDGCVQIPRICLQILAGLRKRISTMH